MKRVSAFLLNSILHPPPTLESASSSHPSSSLFGQHQPRWWWLTHRFPLVFGAVTPRRGFWWGVREGRTAPANCCRGSPGGFACWWAWGAHLSSRAWLATRRLRALFRVCGYARRGALSSRRDRLLVLGCATPRRRSSQSYAQVTLARGVQRRRYWWVSH